MPVTLCIPHSDPFFALKGLPLKIQGEDVRKYISNDGGTACSVGFNCTALFLLKLHIQYYVIHYVMYYPSNSKGPPSVFE